jgi:hypothetical protein
MKTMKLTLIGAFLALAAGVSAQDPIPAGTVLPVRLNSSFSLKTQAGSVISARVMQNVAFPTGAKIPAGARVIGHVIAITPAADGVGARISFTFDKVMASKRAITVTTNLRAMASFGEVEDAQLPDTASDRGTPENAWTTILVGGDMNYRGGGPVVEGSNVVGKPTFDGVLSQIASKPGAGCRAAIDGNNRPQALWVFSADACGMYGFPGIRIAHAGRTNPIGVIVLTSQGKNLRISRGSGILLRVTGSGKTA